MDYLDLYLIHFPSDTSETKYQETWQVMETMVDEGLVRNIGLSDVDATMLQ